MTTEIISKLWIGNYNSAKNIEFIKNKNIKLILNISKNIPIFKSLKTIENIKIIRYDCNENSFNVGKLNKLTSMINTYINNNQGVLIYCNSGLQYSPTIVSLYLIKYANISLEDIESIMITKNKDIFKPDNILRIICEKYIHYNKNI